jgi:hypothetical protein
LLAVFVVVLESRIDVLELHARAGKDTESIAIVHV